MNTSLPTYQPITVHNLEKYQSREKASRTALGDKRRVRVCDRLRSALVKKLSVCVSRLACAEKERRSFSRFLNSSKLDTPDLIDYVCTRSMLGPTLAGRTSCRGEEMLVISDKVNLNLSKAAKRVEGNGGGLGVLEDNKTRGVHAHVSIGINARSLHLAGLCDVILFNRSQRDSSQYTHRKSRGTANSSRLSTHEKESHAWRQGADNAFDLLHQAGSSRCTFIFDSDADSLENFNHLLNIPHTGRPQAAQRGGSPRSRPGADGAPHELEGNFIVRCQYRKRQIKVEPAKKGMPMIHHDAGRASAQASTIGLADYLAQTPFSGTSYSVSLREYDFIANTKRRKARKARTAKIKVKYNALAYQDKAGQLHKLYAVQAWENPQALPKSERSTAIDWILITDREVHTYEQARQIIFYYQQRWHIEQLFRILKKQGFNIEQAQLGSLQALIRIIILAMESSTKILRLVQARHARKGNPIGEVFSASEIDLLHRLNDTYQGKADKQKNPYPPEQLSYAAWIIARMGGWHVYNTRPPGPIVMARGLQQFNNLKNNLDRLGYNQNS